MGLGMQAYGTYTQYRAGRDAASAQNAANAEAARIAQETNQLRQQQVEFQRQQMDIARRERDFQNTRARQMATRATRARVANAIAAGVAGGQSPGSLGSASLNAVAGQRQNLANVLGNQSRSIAATRAQEGLQDSIFSLGQQMANIQTQGAQNISGFNQALANAQSAGARGNLINRSGANIFDNAGGMKTIGKLMG
jgi:hypothetical protein